MQRQDPQPRVQEPVHQHSIRALDRDQLDLHLHQHPAQRPQTGLIVRERGSQKLIARRVADAHIMLLRRPIDAGAITHLVLFLWSSSLTLPPGQEVPLRTLIDRPSTGLRPVAACGTSPPPRGAGLPWALVMGQAGNGSPSAAVEDPTPHRMTYKHENPHLVAGSPEA